MSICTGLSDSKMLDVAYEYANYPMTSSGTFEQHLSLPSLQRQRHRCRHYVFNLPELKLAAKIFQATSGAICTQLNALEMEQDMDWYIC